MSARRWLVALVVATALAGLSVAAVSAAAVTNGDFESGDLSGWTATDDGSGNGGWSASSTGTSSCTGSTNAPDGGYAGLWDMSFISSGILTQDVTVPASGGVLSVNYAYDDSLAGGWIQDGTDPFALGSGNQWLRIDVIKSTAARDTFDPADILATIFDSQSGSPALSQAWVAGTAALDAYAGQTVTFRVATANDSGCLPVWVDDLAVNAAGAGGEQTRAGYCSAPGNINPTTGTAYKPGTFLDLVYGQPSEDSNYANATLANFVEGKGLTCDAPPAGDVLSGTHDPYPYWAPKA